MLQESPSGCSYAAEQVSTCCTFRGTITAVYYHHWNLANIAQHAGASTTSITTTTATTVLSGPVIATFKECLCIILHSDLIAPLVCLLSVLTADLLHNCHASACCEHDSYRFALDAVLVEWQLHQVQISKSFACLLVASY